MSNGTHFALVMGTVMLVCLIITLVFLGEEKYGRLPRGLRWAPGLWDRTKNGISGALLRLFYPEVWAEDEQERQRLRLQERDGMTPWWDDHAKTWRPGDLLEIRNQHGTVMVKRPATYVNYLDKARISNGGSK
jgi:hypothetical protein